MEPCTPDRPYQDRAAAGTAGRSSPAIPWADSLPGAGGLSRLHHRPQRLSPGELSLALRAADPGADADQGLRLRDGPRVLDGGHARPPGVHDGGRANADLAFRGRLSATDARPVRRRVHAGDVPGRLGRRGVLLQPPARNLHPRGEGHGPYPRYPRVLSGTDRPLSPSTTCR